MAPDKESTVGKISHIGARVTLRITSPEGSTRGVKLTDGPVTIGRTAP